MSVVMPAIMALLPASAVTSFDFGSAGVTEDLMQRAGLTPQDSGEFDHIFEYPDAETAVRALSSAAPATRAIRHSGGEAVRHALAAALARFARANGSIALKNRFRWVRAMPRRRG